MRSSGKHRKLTTDPLPWITRQSLTHTDRYRYTHNVNGVLEFEPSKWPGYDRDLHNPANPILEAFRDNVRNPHPDDTEHGTFEEIVALWVWYLSEGNQEVSWDPEDYRHAWLVIGRLANLLGVR